MPFEPKEFRRVLGAIAILAILPAARADEAGEAVDRYLAARRSADLDEMRSRAEALVEIGDPARRVLESRLATAAAELEESLAPWISTPCEARAARVREEFARALRSLVASERSLPDEGASDAAIRRVVARARTALAMSTATDTAPYLDADPGVSEAAGRVEGLSELLVRFPAVRAVPGPDAEALQRAAVRAIDRLAADPAPAGRRRADEAVEEGNREAPLTEVERALLAEVNAYRAAVGLPKLAHDLRLAAAARAHALEMGELGYFGHHSPTRGRKRPADRVAAEGYPWATVGEVLARGDFPPRAVLEAWWASPGHHRALLLADASEAGVARSGDLWVVVLARPRR